MTRSIQDQAKLDFALALRQQWASRMYPQLHDEYEAVCERGNGAAADDPAELVHALPSYGSFAWLERGSQGLLWRAVCEAVDHEPRDEAPVAAWSRLVLDPDLKLPDWYTDWDIHLQPGGVWSSDNAARVYELGARLVMLGENDEYQFHRLFTASAVPEREYRRIVDLGCGFGKSTFPFQLRFPEADVIGVDLSAPCLRLAVRRANERRLRIVFRQANCTATGMPAESADLVTSTMLLHELPVRLLPQLLAESARLLAPGGILRFLDFRYTGNPFRDLAMREHSSRNNEPYLADVLAADVAAMARNAGLRNASWRAFDERGPGLLDDLRWPQRDEWHFPWAVLSAEKPA